jgi:hypothetical protein
MNFNRFCSFSVEDFSVENHEFVTAGKKEYVFRGKRDLSQFVCEEGISEYSRLIGFGYNFSLVAVLKNYDDVLFIFYSNYAF